MARITLRQLLDHAAEHGYGVPAFNINNMEQGLAIMTRRQPSMRPSSSRPRAVRAPMPTTSCYPG
jgi:fructose/tagatose bisphosphate aldolase